MAPKKVALITGGNTGIGRETALALAKENMKVFITSRDVDKGRKAISYIHEINNAGAAMGTPWYTGEGVGGSAQVNFLGPFTFTRLLEEELALGAPSRVVNVSSVTHRRAYIPDVEKFFRNYQAGQYSECKLANVLFTMEINRRWGGKGIEACAVDPGAVASDIWRRGKYKKPPFTWIIKSTYAPTWDGAKPVIHAATAKLDAPKKEETPVRYFARGFFASPLVLVNPAHTGLFMSTMAFIVVTGAFLDWPVRNLSFGWIGSETKDIPAGNHAYDLQLASTVWKEASLIAGLGDK